MQRVIVVLDCQGNAHCCAYNDRGRGGDRKADLRLAARRGAGAHLRGEHRNGDDALATTGARWRP